MREERGGGKLKYHQPMRGGIEGPTEGVVELYRPMREGRGGAYLAELKYHKPIRGLI
jgi:hypothetical protein